MSGNDDPAYRESASIAGRIRRRHRQLAQGEKAVKLIEAKFKSGNDVPVPAIRITREEWYGEE